LSVLPEPFSRRPLGGHRIQQRHPSPCSPAWRVSARCEGRPQSSCRCCVPARTFPSVAGAGPMADRKPLASSL